MGLRTSKNRRTARRGTGKNARVSSGALSAISTVLKLTLVAFGVVTLVVGGKAAWKWLHATPDLALETVRFSGITRAKAADLLSMGGLHTGQNLLALAPEAVEKALSAHPWISKVAVTRHFPHGVSVKIVEHEPQALVALGDVYLVNEEGTPFRQLQPDDSLNLPLITGVDREAFLANAEATVKRFREGLDVAKRYAKSEASEGSPLSEIRLESDGITLIVGKGEELVLGSDGLDEKLKKLMRIRTELALRGLEASRIRLDNRARPGWVSVQLTTATP